MNRNTLIALGVFAALVVGYFATREEKAVGIRRLAVPKLSADAITTLEVSGPFSTRLTKEATGWMVGNPSTPDKKYPADDAQVKGALDAIASFAAPDFISDKTERHAEMEIDEAKGLKVKATPTTGQPFELVFGKAAKAGGTYVRLAGAKEVFSTPSGLAFSAKRDVNAWRRRSLDGPKPDDATTVVVTHPDGTSLQLAREGEGWKVTSPTPPGFRFDNGAATQLVNQLGGLSAQGFSDGESDDALGLSAASASTLQVTQKDGKSRTLTFGTKRPDGTYPMRMDGDAQVYLLPGWQVEALTKGLEGVRDMTLLSYEPAKVTKVTVQAGAKRAVVTKNGETWALVEPKAPAGFEFDPAQVTRQLERWRALRGTKVVAGVDDTAAGFAKPSAQLELTVEGGPVQRLRFGSTAGNAAGVEEVYAKGTADALTYAAPASEKASLETAHELFKKAPPPPDWSNARGLEQLPPEIRKQLEAQMRQQMPH